MKFNLLIIYLLTVFLITKPAIGSEVMRPEYSYKADHPEPNLIITSGDIIHKNIYDDQSGKVVLIMIIKFELNLWKCIVTNLDPILKSTSQCSSIEKDGIELPRKLKWF